MSVSQNFENSQFMQQMLLEMWKKKNKLNEENNFNSKHFKHTYFENPITSQQNNY